MKSKKITALLLLGLIFFTSSILFINLSNKNLNFKNRPNLLSSNKHTIILRGAVNKEGPYTITPNTDLAILITEAGGLSADANYEEIKKLKNIDLYSVDTLFIPSIFKDKLYINYSTPEEISNFLNISLQDAKKIIRKCPFLTKEQIKIATNLSDFELDGIIL